MPALESKAAPRTYVVALCILGIFFVGPCAAIFFMSGDPKGLYITLPVLAFVLVNVSSIRFRCTESLVMYTSLLKRQEIKIDDIAEVYIGPTDETRRSPMFYLVTKENRKIMLLVRVLPLHDVQRFARYLDSLGIPFSVHPGWLSQRMASQILPQKEPR